MNAAVHCSCYGGSFSHKTIVVNCGKQLKKSLFNLCTPNVAPKKLAFLQCIREVPGSYLDQDPGYPNRFFVVFLGFSGKYRIINLATAASFGILSNLLFIAHTTNRCCKPVVLDTASLNKTETLLKHTHAIY